MFLVRFVCLDGFAVHSRGTNPLPSARHRRRRRSSARLRDQSRFRTSLNVVGIVDCEDEKQSESEDFLSERLRRCDITDITMQSCQICKGSASICVPTLSNRKRSFCLLHYYSTGVHRDLSSAKHARIRKSRSLLVENGRIAEQLPAVQEVFAEAFVDLQRQLGEESALALTGAASKSNEDPLAALLESTSKMPSMLLSSSFRRSSSTGRKKKKGDKINRQQPVGANDDLEGGFLRDRELPEEFKKLQRPEKLETYARKMGVDRADPAEAKRPSAGTAVTAENPYRRRKRPRQNLWNQVLDSQAPDQRQGKGVKGTPKMNFAQMERAMIDDITGSAGGDDRGVLCPSCGSSSIEVRSGVTSKNNEMSKGEVWGRKETDPVVERCCCRECGKAWNRDE